MKKCCVFFAVGTIFLNIIQINFVLQRVISILMLMLTCRDRIKAISDTN
jgi:hypothetical protein